MQLQTTINISEFSQKITYRTPILFIGSCFAANIGNELLQRRFPAIVNPFGVCYNPQSIAKSLQRLQTNKLFSETDLVCCNELWTTFSHHSSFSNPDANIFLQQANDALNKGHEIFKKTKFIIVSLGTSWAYRHKATKQIVSNCHKFSAADFERVFLSADETTTILSKEITEKPDCQWILTVSPIRHWKDGAHGNQLSKANLLIAIEKLQQQFSNVHYFPAYEIMMDELRDYRFYADDMLHPSKQAIDYIWQRFSNVAFDDETKKISGEIEKIITAQQHRPLHSNTSSYQKFSQNLAQQIQDFSTRYPHINIDL